MRLFGTFLSLLVGTSAQGDAWRGPDLPLFDMTNTPSLVHRASSVGFERWITDFRRRALSRGIRPSTFDQAFQGVRFNQDVIAQDRNQSEFTKQIWDYLDSAVSTTRIRNGQSALRTNRKLLRDIEETYGVDADIVVAIWGLESAYGQVRGSIPVVEALATLAYDGRRGQFFEAQLIAALEILQSGDVRPVEMRGSWAGAMGHTQFIPTSYLAYGQDFTGDGTRNIWSDNPADALASTAAYLKHFGWTKHQPWGVEVQLPRDFEYQQAGERIKKTTAQWAALGVRDIKGQIVPDHGAASILLPAGSGGAAFMIFNNFHVIERYNTADAYVIGVGHLADRIANRPAIQTPWPREDRNLSHDEKRELQRRLTASGFETYGSDGIIGPNTIAAIRAYQNSRKLVADGYASFDLLESLR